MSLIPPPPGYSFLSIGEVMTTDDRYRSMSGTEWEPVRALAGGKVSEHLYGRIARKTNSPKTPKQTMAMATKEGWGTW